MLINKKSKYSIFNNMLTSCDSQTYWEIKFTTSSEIEPGTFGLQVKCFTVTEVSGPNTKRF